MFPIPFTLFTLSALVAPATPTHQSRKTQRGSAAVRVARGSERSRMPACGRIELCTWGLASFAVLALLLSGGDVEEPVQLPWP